ncbi:DUF1365 domain-containing protein [Massilia glaciei]|uniref:DUF1365 domain-containing protein n=1 Tax=Massilia glaciei TaxID=1524097 RepID=A0A2U2HGL9_9BURK|nr:DUF1365 domain-containing protein [Massilia glaciei]PWF44330.1 DUF1365 domain-containing protein [Massilia glaciei]
MQPLDSVIEAAPQLCFGQVRHKRLRPARNAFEYPAYYVRLPLRAMGRGGFDCALFSRNRFNLLAFHDRDHGDGERPLCDWIDALLRAEGVTDADGEIWLQAMPRVLGFVFNPVSFWFCHRRDGALRAVLCDVRNTFGERHFYLLEQGGAIGNGAELGARKVFHVSPFCDVTGSYRFRFMRAMRRVDGRALESTLACIDYDDGAGPLLETSVSGAGAPISSGAVARAFFSFPLMTFGVVARIHLQALRLWIRRVPFFSKPAPPQQKVTR